MKQEVNNFDLIRPLLEWKEEGDYYYISLYLRKKDGTTTFGNKNNSARLIKSYCFYNIQQFNHKEVEIIELCNLFKCRAGISLNKRNDKRILMELLKQVTDRITSNNSIGINGILNTANGRQTSKDRYWLIDCDSQEEYEAISEILKSDSIRPIGEKILGVLPTYSGYHIITSKFDVMTYSKLCKEKGVSPELHRNNPFCLFYPEIN